MFLSTDKPPNNPSSSSNFLHFTSFSDELDPLNLPSFSIRDYTYSYRTKNINNNWPFSSKSLQLCLKHGLLHPLPSFHPFDHVIRTLHSMETSPLKKQITPQKGFENGFWLPITSRSRSKSKNPMKKCRFTVNLGSKEDSFVAISESMAMRTCPICKTFSSASNTTLNVHIDQCLSVDSRRQPFSKPNRPLKVKLMTDIYASARRCTLEDLDQRNGTKWASVSSYSNQVVTDYKSEMSKKEKNRRLLSVDMDEIGPVYTDAKGQKLRILSEFREKASTQAREGEERFKETVVKGNDVLDNSKDTDGEFESMIYEKSSCNSAEQGSSLMEFDPIPIPGPPGSFLLSPWDIITDENLGNSSSQIQSSQEQLDFTDKNSTESSVSAFSVTRLSTNSNLNTKLSISDIVLDQDFDLLSKSLHFVPAIPSNQVLRLMGKDLMITNQEESTRSVYIIP